MERHERQQALASARTPVSRFLEKSDSIGTRETGAPVLHKLMRGPWDGLGVNRRDMEKDREAEGDDFQVASSALDTRKRVASSLVQRAVVSQRLKIVGVKSHNEAQKCTPSAEPSNTLETSSTAQWKGLVGYGSEDSDDDHAGDTPG